MSKVRQRRSTWVGILVVVVFFTGVTLAVAMVGGGPDIPHSAAGGHAGCVTCHPTDRLPDGHDDRVDEQLPLVPLGDVRGRRAGAPLSGW